MKFVSLSILLACAQAAANPGSDARGVPPGSKDERTLIEAAFNLDVQGVERLVKAGVNAHASYGSSENEKQFQDPWTKGCTTSYAFQHWNALIAVANSHTYPPPRWYDDVEKMRYEDIVRHWRQMPECWVQERNERRVKIAAILVDSGMVISNEVSGAIALETAIAQRYKELAFFLINEGAKVVRLRPDGFVDDNNPLHLAIGCADLVAALIEAGAPVNARLSPGAGHGMFFKMTPLHLAVMKGDLASVKLLVDAGADMTLTEKDGRTPSQLIGEITDDSPLNQAIVRLLAKSTNAKRTEEVGGGDGGQGP